MCLMIMDPEAASHPLLPEAWDILDGERIRCFILSNDQLALGICNTKREDDRRWTYTKCLP